MDLPAILMYNRVEVLVVGTVGILIHVESLYHTPCLHRTSMFCCVNSLPDSNEIHGGSSDTHELVVYGATLKSCS